MQSNLNVQLAQRRMTKRQLEEKLGVSHSTLWKWSTDKGIEKITLEKLMQLACALGCEVKDLFDE